MRKLIVIILVLAAAWGSYWFIGATATQKAFAAWIEQRQSDGWLAQVDSLKTRGFPSRFDTIFKGLELADPDTGLAWKASEFQLLALSYKPHHLIAVWPGTQTLSTPQQSISISADDLKGSVVVSPTPDLLLERSSFVLENARLDSTNGWKAALEHGTFALRHLSTQPHRYELSFEAQNLTAPAHLMTTLSTAKVLPKIMEGLTIRAKVDFSAPWDRRAIEVARPQPTRIELDTFKAQWGALGLRLAGSVDISAAGIPEGEITVKAQNWREMIEIAQNLGIFTPDFSGTLTSALQLIAGLSGNSQTLDIPLRLSSGVIFFGPIPVGQTPILKLR